MEISLSFLLLLQNTTWLVPNLLPSCVIGPKKLEITAGSRKGQRQNLLRSTQLIILSLVVLSTST
jgi:hypothetical protein